MIKIFLTVAALAVLGMTSVNAGGILTNTNQSARFARLFALEGYTQGADLAYYNPAGTIKLPEGFHITFSNQSAFQKRIINSTYAPYVMNGGSDYKQFVGTASAPIIPSVHGVYRKGNWALSGAISLIGGGGKATFDNGVSQFESAIAGIANGMQTSAGVTKYTFNTYMSGSNFIYGAQLGGAYKINEMFSVYGGFRLNIVQNKYEGYLNDVKVNPGNGEMTSLPGLIGGMLANPDLDADTRTKLQTAYVVTSDMELHSKQSGWGVAPIIGVNFTYERLNIGAKYEFKSALDVENKTKFNQDLILPQFKDGVNTAHDVPALFAIGASYNVIDPLTVNVSYHHFFDKDAKMADDKQKHLKRGTNEFLAGVEYQINPMFLVSMGGQLTRYGLTDDFQSDLSFYCNSYSLGFGGAVNVAKNVQINVGYFFTHYDKYNMTIEAGKPVTSYERRNKVFTAGVDFSF